jgi:hypothetical protein
LVCSDWPPRGTTIWPAPNCSGRAMIIGVVNANREATIRLVVIDPSGQQQEIEAIIDPGCPGF